MKKLLLLSICLAAALTLWAQTQQGYVKTIGKRGQKGQALSGVTVRVKGEHNAVVSKADGTFSMPMPGKKNGQPYTLQQVQKNGYELNEKTVIGRQYAFSSTVPLTIVMVSSAQLQADKQRIENNAYKTAEKNYKAQMAQLEKQLKEKSISEEQYRADLQELQDKFEKYQNLIDELAEHYAHTDYDELDEKEAEVNVLIENGELERADSLIHTLFDPVDVLKRNKESLATLTRPSPALKESSTRPMLTSPLSSNSKRRMPNTSTSSIPSLLPNSTTNAPRVTSKPAPISTPPTPNGKTRQECFLLSMQLIML